MTMITKIDFIEKSVALSEQAETADLSNTGYGCVYVGGNGVDTVTNYSNGSKIITGGGDDSVTSIAGGVVIDTADGDDSIIAIGMGTEISAGAGDDKLYVQYVNENTKISIGTGADVVYMTGKGSANTLAPSEDNIADFYLTPGFTFKYVKNQGLIMEQYYWNDDSDDDKNHGSGCQCGCRK